MTRRGLVATSSLLVLVATLWVCARGVGPIPPVGPLLDPLNGAWSAVRHAELPRAASAVIPGLGGVVDVRYDRRGVPHIFAADEIDAIRALGYVVARDRLFQLEAQTHAAAGRLTEWAGQRALELDRQTRHLGLPRAAERLAASLDSSSVGARLIRAYAEGVNAWIDQLKPGDWPVEYRLLNQRPERWQPVNSLYLLGRMSWTLTYNPEERQRLEVQARIGRAAMEALFPVNTPIQEPIQPNGSNGPRFDFGTLPPPGPPDSTAALVAAHYPWAAVDDHPELRHFASNNWAVAPQRTRERHALLAGDPHLELTLPSIWYEAHVVVPGKLDVYGVTIPGVPGIVIGFTRDLAWSFTNTGADVLDFYWETLDDAKEPSSYSVDGVWRPLERRIETYRGPGGEALAVDTVRYTHRGPVERWNGRAVSMRWTALEQQDEASAFLAAAGSKTAREFLDQMAAHFMVPAQNIVVADRHGTIAIRSTGHFPFRPDSLGGLVVRDGSRSAADWTGFWPVQQYPQSFDPAQGFLASANQEPIDPRVNGTYLGFDRGYDPWRALQINRLLRADSSMTVDKMRAFQTDPGSVRADLFVPPLLAAVARHRAGVARTASLDSAGALLASWDRRYTRQQDAALLFELTLRTMSRLTWDELADSTGRPVASPTLAVLLDLVSDSSSPWWDVRRTSGVVERRDDIIVRALAQSWDSLQARYGPRAEGRWQWRERGTASINHLLQLPGFSERGISVQGGPGTLNPSTSGFGSSWRMVVALDSTVHAFGTYPGGQSGNPASSRYIDRLPLWRDGLLDTLFAPATPSDLPAISTRATLTLHPASVR